MPNDKGLSCPQCQEVSKDKEGAKLHIREYHSRKCKVWLVNEQGIKESIVLMRVQGCFVCPVCSKPIQTRDGITKHTNRHGKKNDSGFVCPICGETLKSALELDHHFGAHTQPRELAESDASDDIEVLKQGKAELDLATKNPIFSDCFLETLVPFSLEHESGARSIALLTQIGAKRTAEDQIIAINPIKKPKKPSSMEPKDFKFLLSSHRYGRLIDIERYKPLDATFFLLNYEALKFDIAKNLAGAVIQTGLQAILILKAEVYGREPKEDPHCFDLLKPTLDLKRVSSINHDNTNKLVIGTHTWSALITASIELVSGAIDVGANNSTAHIGAYTTIWGRDDWQQNLLLERQLRSKFHCKATYFQSASMFYLFANWACYPTTIFRLENYYQGSRVISGVKAAASIFHQIANTRSIKRKRLLKLLRKLDSPDQSQKAPVTKNAIMELLELIPSNKKKLKLTDNAEASTILVMLASGLCGVIRDINKKQVRPAIQATVEAILQDKENARQRQEQGL
ncbi:hypothetical protein BX616_006712 [Lobosporangium transversale]|uniref:C2H2-type domain-containing protein n=1 Tax=Lobosporangium transversale TaxID=64571 RepID=A0A1Y2G0D7_9FUNG|nr:hypothetical protein BCR41DRAFT_376164 [Lobosporangium transversale]XP_021875028.1 hypothetical protein BCR41DRAFT_25641 [Lobosporangium transversale]XP_021875038.1 hypothetical protein BCR41DRAFT_25434 [Lobosporangium transversale]KAF9896812.1 hypothetical protein BX616_006712 [Lobosporangium transversale]ORY88704.1 hypothetical protein BCR41DRAFT_376164 [Lobosporangium transversale]ORY88928.1 hypothetical protein BCR41DRAFT_25641 [Lobosporangium transversale]ORY89178.1 hypothetical prote|eukprot:XP_021875012.1 hypothetical protein BCR41DRAFT_376164 [Lobosporangium transversale]